MRRLIVLFSLVVGVLMGAGCMDDSGKDQEIESYRVTVEMLNKRVAELKESADVVSPVIPTVAAFTNPYTIEELHRRFFLSVEEARCGETEAFLYLLNNLRHGRSADCHEWRTLEKIYHMRLGSLCQMAGWDLVWYHTALGLVPSYIKECRPFVYTTQFEKREGSDVAFEKTYSCGLLDSATCSATITAAINRDIGEALYPGLTNPEQSAAKLVELVQKFGWGMSTDKWRAFTVYFGTVWDEQQRLGQAAEVSGNYEAAIAYAERWFPFGDVSVPFWVEPMLVDLACGEHNLSQKRRQRFVDLVRRRVVQTKFWLVTSTGYPFGIPPTVGEFCELYDREE